jgi:hypothetical protein
MKVKELITLLSKLDPEISIYGSCEDGDVLENNQAVRLFDFDQADALDAVLTRLPDGTLQADLVSSGEGRKIAFLGMTTAR